MLAVSIPFTKRGTFSAISARGGAPLDIFFALVSFSCSFCFTLGLFFGYGLHWSRRYGTAFSFSFGSWIFLLSPSLPAYTELGETGAVVGKCYIRKMIREPGQTQGLEHPASYMACHFWPGPPLCWIVFSLLNILLLNILSEKAEIDTLRNDMVRRRTSPPQSSLSFLAYWVG